MGNLLAKFQVSLLSNLHFDGTVTSLPRPLSRSCLGPLCLFLSFLLCLHLLQQQTPNTPIPVPARKETIVCPMFHNDRAQSGIFSCRVDGVFVVGDVGVVGVVGVVGMYKATKERVDTQYYRQLIFSCPNHCTRIQIHVCCYFLACNKSVQILHS